MKNFHPKLDWRPSDWLRWSVPTCVGLSLFADESGLLDQTDVWILWYILTTHYSYILLSKISLQSPQHQTDWITALGLEFHLRNISNPPFNFISFFLLIIKYFDMKGSSPNYIKEIILKTCHLYNFEIFKGYCWESKSNQ